MSRVLAVVGTLVISVATTGCLPATLVRVTDQPLPDVTAMLQGSPGSKPARSPRASAVRHERAYDAPSHRVQVNAVDRALALGDVQMRSARLREPRDRRAAQGHYLAAAAHADEALRTLSGDPAAWYDGRVQVARSLYNAAAGRFLQAWLGQASTPGPVDVHAGGRRFRVETGDAETRELLATYGELHLAWGLGIEGIATRHVRDGIGVPLVGWRAAPVAGRAWRYGPEGLAAPLTAVLRFEATTGDHARARVIVRDSRRKNDVDLHGRPVALAADFTAPIAFSWSRSRSAALGRQGILRADAVEAQRGFRLVEPFDPGRIPVVLVHGLLSSEQAWRDVANEIAGSEELRERYQVWMYFYPTAEPFIFAARRFRDDMATLRAELGVPPETRVVVVGHSMGGLIAKALAVDTGTRLWETVFNVPPRELSVGEGRRREFEELLVFRPDPGVGRLVFIATPHGGSELADAWWARVAEQFISLPEALTVQLRAVCESDQRSVRSGMRYWFAAARGTSIDSLSPRQPLLREFRKIGVDPRVPFHTVYGVARGSGADLGDGVVRAEAARHEGAASELAARFTHRNFETPQVLDELVRILREHRDLRTAAGK